MTKDKSLPALPQVGAQSPLEVRRNELLALLPATF